MPAIAANLGLNDTGDHGSGFPVILATSAVEEKRIDPLLRFQGAKIRTIKDHKSIEMEYRKARFPSISKSYECWVSIIKNIVGKIEVSVPDLSVGLTLSSAQEKIVYAKDCQSVSVKIYEDDISPELFSKYFELYTNIPKSVRPTFFIIAKNNLKTLRDKLRLSIPAINPHELPISGSLSKKKLEPGGCTDIDNVLSQYIGGAHSSVAATTDSVLYEEHCDLSFSLPRVYSLFLMRLRSKSFVSSKFHTINETKSFHSKLQKIRMKTKNKKKLELIDVILLLNSLWLVYATEKTENILQNNIALAKNLKNELLTAHCYRFVNMAVGTSSYATHVLQEAIKIFTRYNANEHAFYCANNINAANFHSFDNNPQSCSDLANEIEDTFPNIMGLSIFFNNAGVSHMLNRDWEKSLTYLELGLNKPGTDLHRLGIETNRLLVKSILNDSDVKDEAARIASTADKRISGISPYHKASILFNLWRAAPDAVQDVVDLSFHKSAVSNAIGISGFNLKEFPLILNNNMNRAYVGELSRHNYAGMRGQYMKEFGALPIYHFTWL